MSDVVVAKLEAIFELLERIDQRLSAPYQNSLGIDPERRYSVPEAAELLGLKPPTIYRYAEEGRIPKIQNGSSRVKFLGSTLAKYHAEQVRKAAGGAA